MRKWTRRDFTKCVGLTTLFTPFISYLNPAVAQSAPGPAKYLFIFFTNGTEPREWKPSGGPLYSKMTEPLQPLESDLVLIDNLNSNGTAGNHAAPGGLTGANYGSQPLISLEQFASDQLREMGVRTQIPNLILGGVASESQSTFYRNNQPISPIFSPTAAYSAVFGGGGAAIELPGSSESGETSAEARLRRRQSVLDGITNELRHLQEALGVEERAKLEAHAESIRQLESRLAQQAEQQNNPDPVVVSCNTPPAPAGGGDDLANSVIHMEVAINAFACDLTRVAAVQFGHHQQTQVNVTSPPGDWHNGFMHSDPGPERRIEIERWCAEQFVKAAQQLKNTPAPDGNGTLFDQTLMLWARDMGDAVAHDGSDMRFVLSGGAGGYLRRGGNYINGGGEAHQKILFNALEALGITSTTGFGNPTGDRAPVASVRA